MQRRCPRRVRRRRAGREGSRSGEHPPPDELVGEHRRAEARELLRHELRGVQAGRPKPGPSSVAPSGRDEVRIHQRVRSSRAVGEQAQWTPLATSARLRRSARSRLKCRSARPPAPSWCSAASRLTSAYTFARSGNGSAMGVTSTVRPIATTTRWPSATLELIAALISHPRRSARGRFRETSAGLGYLSRRRAAETVRRPRDPGSAGRGSTTTLWRRAADVVIAHLSAATALNRPPRVNPHL